MRLLLASHYALAWEEDLRTRLFVWHKISSEICTLVVVWVAESAFLCAYYSPRTMHSLGKKICGLAFFVWHKISSILSAVYRLLSAGAKRPLN